MARRYPPELAFLPPDQEKQANKDYDRRRRKRNWKIARRIGYAATALTVGIGFAVNHVNHERAVAAAERLDKARAKDRIALALPYRNPDITRVTDTHEVVDGRDSVRLTFRLPFTEQAKRVRKTYAQSSDVNWLDTPGAVIYPVETVNRQPLVTPMRGDHRPGMIPGSLLFPLTVDPAGIPKFNEAFQGRNSGAEIDMQGETGSVTAELPVSDEPGSEVAVYVSNTSTSTQNNVLSETEGEQYVTTLRLVRGDNGQNQWQVMSQPPHLPNLYGVANEQVPNGPTM